MRNIKLRVWHEKKVEYVFCSLRELLEGIGDDCPDQNVCDFVSAVNNGETIEQCISSHEVDMYDGDIVTCPGHPDNLTGRIYYNEVAGGFSIIQDGICHYPNRFWKWIDLKVIGNIRQNPELLNQE